MPIPHDIESRLVQLSRSNERWVEQYRRVHRWYERLKQPMPASRSGPLAPLDYYYAFFLNCYHLQDWLGKDTDWPHLKEKEHAPLGPNFVLCANIANANKHLNSDPHLNQVDWVEWDQRRDVWNGGPRAWIDGRDALDLASKCVEKWDEYIRKWLV